METDLSRIERFRQFKQEIRGNEGYLIVGIDAAKDRHHAFLGFVILLQHYLQYI